MLADAGHVDRANRICLASNYGAIGDESICFLSVLPRANLFTPRTNTMRSFFVHQHHLGVLNYVIESMT